MTQSHETTSDPLKLIELRTQWCRARLEKLAGMFHTKLWTNITAGLEANWLVNELRRTVDAGSPLLVGIRRLQLRAWLPW